MALTSSEKQRVLDMLDEMDRSTVQRVLASVEAFADWLANSLYFIYVKVKDSIYSIWDSIVSSIADTLEGVAEMAVQTGKIVAESEFGKNVARSEFGQAVSKLWRKNRDPFS
jgi:cephalosporin hydroxylase